MRAAKPAVAAAPESASTSVSWIRFVTCGNVDDGKSTLVGRLLHDTGCLTDDQLAQLHAESRRRGAETPDFSLVFDGLEAEREQGVTIDVAHRYFSTARRRFTVLDAPGHQQYTAKMAAACSHADAAVIVVDAVRGLAEQTRRHAQIVSLMGVRQIVLAVNKMDAADFSRPAFDAVAAAFGKLAGALDLQRIECIPVSALRGDNVFVRSEAMAWYDGPTLMACLESLTSAGALDDGPLRLPIQFVVRNGAARRYCGSVRSGVLRAGQKVAVYPGRLAATVARIWDGSEAIEAAHSGCAIGVELVETIDIGRGAILADGAAAPELSDRVAATLLWMDQSPLFPGRDYLMRAGTAEVHASVTRIHDKRDADMVLHPDVRHLEANEIGRCSVKLGALLAFDPYRICRPTGGFVLIDPVTRTTAAAGLFHGPEAVSTNLVWQVLDVDKRARSTIKGHLPCVLWLTGLSGAGKSTVANLVERALHASGVHTYVLDGDNIRHGLNQDLGFAPEDRVENVRRIAEVARLFADAGLVVLVSAISPFRQERRAARALVGPTEFVEIHVSASVETCERRDPKGLYRRARLGEIPHFTGISSPYEAPEAPEIVVDTETGTAEAAALRIVEWLQQRGIVGRGPLA